MVESVKDLYNHEDLNSDLQHPGKNQGVVVHSCIPGNEEAETGGLLGLD